MKKGRGGRGGEGNMWEGEERERGEGEGEMWEGEGERVMCGRGDDMNFIRMVVSLWA